MKNADFRPGDIVISKLNGEIFVVSKISFHRHRGAGLWIDLQSMIDGRVLVIGDVLCQWYELIHRQ